MYASKTKNMITLQYSIFLFLLKLSNCQKSIKFSFDDAYYTNTKHPLNSYEIPSNKEGRITEIVDYSGNRKGNLISVFKQGEIV